MQKGIGKNTSYPSSKEENQGIRQGKKRIRGIPQYLRHGLSTDYRNNKRGFAKGILAKQNTLVTQCGWRNYFDWRKAYQFRIGFQER